LDIDSPNETRNELLGITGNVYFIHHSVLVTSGGNGAYLTTNRVIFFFVRKLDKQWAWRANCGTSVLIDPLVKVILIC